MGSQRVGHDWVTEMNWTELNRVQFCSVDGFYFQANKKKKKRTKKLFQRKEAKGKMAIKGNICDTWLDLEPEKN